MDSGSPNHQVSKTTEVEHFPHTLTTSPRGRYGSAFYQGQSPSSIRRRLADTLRRKLHRSSSTKGDTESPSILQRRKSIIGLFSSGSSKSQTLPEEALCAKEIPISRPGTTFSYKSHDGVAAPARPIQRRKSLSGMLVSISDKVSPRRNSLFRRAQEPQAGFASARGEIDESMCFSDSVKFRPGSPKLEGEIHPLSTILSPSQEHILFTDSLMTLFKEFKEKKLDSRCNSACSSYSWDSRILALSPNVSPSQTPRSRKMDEDRKGTPDSYLQLLIESMNSNNSLPIEAQEYGIQPSFSSSVPSKDRSTQQVDMTEHSGHNAFKSRRSNSDQQMPTTPTCEEKAIFKKSLMRLSAVSTKALSNTHPSLDQNVPISRADRLPLKVEEIGTQPSLNPDLNRIPKLAQTCRNNALVFLSNVGHSQRLGQDQDQSHQLIREKRIHLTTIRMTENFHLKLEPNQRGLHSVKDVVLFEEDQNRVWDAIIVGIEIMQKVNPPTTLKSFPSCENISVTRRTNKVSLRPICVDDLSSNVPESPEHKVPRCEVPIRLKLFGDYDDMSQELNTSLPNSLRDENLVRKSHHTFQLPKLVVNSKPKRQISTASAVSKKQGFEKHHCGYTTNNVIGPEGSHQQQCQENPIIIKKTNISLDSELKSEAYKSIFRVEYPSVPTRFAHVETYKSKEHAMIAISNYKYCELSEYAILDPETRTIHARLPETGKLDPAAIEEYGLEVLWLPMSLREHKEYKTQTYKCSVQGNHKRLASANFRDGIDGVSGAFLVTHELHSSPALKSPESRPIAISSQDEEVESTFDENFFLEVDSQISQSFLGSQYSEQHCDSRLSSPGDECALRKDDRLNNDMFHWKDKEEKVSPAPTWAELGRAFQGKALVNRSEKPVELQKCFVAIQETNMGMIQDCNKSWQCNIGNDVYSQDESTCKVSICSCSTTGLYEGLYGAKGESHGLCIRCATKIIDKEDSSTTHHHTDGHLRLDVDPINSLEEPENTKVGVTGVADDKYGIPTCDKPTLLGPNSDRVLEIAEVPGFLRLEELGEDLSPHQIRDSVEEVRAQSRHIGLTAEPMNEVKLPRLLSTNRHDYTLEIPTGGNFSWAAFLDGNIPGLVPLYGARSLKLSPDKINTFDNSESFILEDSNCQLQTEHKYYNVSSQITTTSKDTQPKRSSFKNDDNLSGVSEQLSQDIDLNILNNDPSSHEIDRFGSTFKVTSGSGQPQLTNFDDLLNASIPREVSSGSTTSHITLPEGYRFSKYGEQLGLDSDIDPSPEGSSEISYTSDETNPAMRSGFKFMCHDHRHLESTGTCSYPVSTSEEAQKSPTADTVTPKKINKVSALVQILQARGSLQTGYGSIRPQQGFSRSDKHCPQRANVLTPLSPKIRPVPTLSDLDIDVGSTRDWPL